MVRLSSGLGALLLFALSAAVWGQPELVPIGCDETIEEAASCAGPFIICDRQYVIEVPEGATRLTIDLHPPAGVDGSWDLDVFVGFGEPVDQDRLSETTVAFSDEVGPDTVTISGDDLRPGTYYIAIGNPNFDPQPFELAVTVDPCSRCSPQQELLAQSAVRLELGRVQTGSVKAASGSSQLAEPQYWIEIVEETKALAIGLASESGGNLDLHVQVGCALEPGSRGIAADFSLISPVGFEFIVLSDAQLRPGIYYLAVENKEATDQNFSIAAAAVPMLSEPFRADGSAEGKVETEPEGLLAFLQHLLQTERGTLAATQYVLEVESAVKSLTIEVEGTGALNLHIRFDKPVEVEDDTVLADLSLLGLSGRKSLTLGRNLLREGRYFVAIEGLEGVSQEFSIHFTFEQDGTTVTVTKTYRLSPQNLDLIEISTNSS